MPFSTNSKVENPFCAEGLNPSLSQNFEIKTEDNITPIPDFTTIDRCKKLQTLLTAGTQKDEAVNLQHILTNQFCNRTVFHLNIKGGDKFFLALSHSLPNCANLENSKAIAETWRTLARYVYRLKEYAEVI